MANAQHISILKLGVANWNQWRKANPDIKPDLSEEQLGFIDSRLHRYSKPGINTAVFSRFTTQNYSGINFSRTNLFGCIFREVILDKVDFQEANLSHSEFRQVAISNATMSRSDLRAANFILTTFDEVNFEGAVFGQSHFGYSPIRNCNGLHRVAHASESHMDFLTLQHSTKLPLEFVYHFGVERDYYEQITRLRSETYYDCFISYSTKDVEFVQVLRETLINKGVPCWFAPNDYRLNTPWFAQKLPSYELGRDLFNFIDASEIVLLVVSTQSLNSDWVNEEMIRSYQVRKVIPIWLEDIDFHQIKKERHWYNPVVQNGVIDFRRWKDTESFAQQVAYLLQFLIREFRNK